MFLKNIYIYIKKQDAAHILFCDRLLRIDLTIILYGSNHDKTKKEARIFNIREEFVKDGLSYKAVYLYE